VGVLVGLFRDFKVKPVPIKGEDAVGSDQDGHGNEVAFADAASGKRRCWSG